MENTATRVLKELFIKDFKNILDRIFFNDETVEKNLSISLVKKFRDVEQSLLTYGDGPSDSVEEDEDLRGLKGVELINLSKYNHGPEPYYYLFITENQGSYFLKEEKSLLKIVDTVPLSSSSKLLRDMLRNLFYEDRHQNVISCY